MDAQFSMSRPGAGLAAAQSHVLRFESLFNPGRAVAVPCDASGRVNLDAMSERLRNTYLGARAMVGREYACPKVQPAF